MKFIGDLPARVDNLSTKNKRILKRLQSTPGKWWEIRTYYGDTKNNAYVYAHNCRRGAIPALSPLMGVEVKATASEDDGVSVMARFIGIDKEYLDVPDTPAE